MHLLPPLLALAYAFACRQTRCLCSLLEVGSTKTLFLGCLAPLLGVPVWGQVAQDGGQGWQGAQAI